jgi:glutamyl-tRNA synthetase
MGLKHGDLFMTLRIALTGRRVTPPLIESMVELGKPRVLKILRERLKS